MIRALTLLLAIANCSFNAKAEDAPSPRLSDERMIFHTNAGDLVFAFYSDLAPKHQAHIIELAKEGIYDSVQVHRVHKSFLLQFSDTGLRSVPVTLYQSKFIKPVAAELNGLLHTPWRLTMAHNDNDLDSAVMSFSIMLGNAPHLDGKYTVFGELVSGKDVVNEMIIATPEPNVSTVPTVEIRVLSAEVVSLKELETRKLAAALPLPKPASNYKPPPPPPVVNVVELQTVLISVGVGTTVGFCILGLVLSRIYPGRVFPALVMLAVLNGAFVLFAALHPLTKGNSELGVFLFIGLIALFKFMGRFESAT